MPFDESIYTDEAAAKQLLLIQLHGSDGSASDAGCTCIQDKHLLALEAIAEEGATLKDSEKERQFYQQLSELTRKLRKTILDETFEMPHNPIGPARASSSCDEKIEQCILQVKETGCKPPKCNPWAICHNSVRCP